MYLFLQKASSLLPIPPPAQLNVILLISKIVDLISNTVLARKISDHFENFMEAMDPPSPPHTHMCAHTHVIVDFVGEAHRPRLHYCPGPFLITLIIIFLVLR